MRLIALIFFCYVFFFLFFFSTLTEQIQRISLENDKNSNMHAVCVRKTSANSSIASPSLSCSSSMSSGSSGVSNASTASATKFQLLTATKDQSIQDCNDSTNQRTTKQLVHTKDGEPIYAVVNLRDKYEHRAKKKSLDEQHGIEYIQRRERPNSFHVASGDYEEVRKTITIKLHLFNKKKIIINELLLVWFHICSGASTIGRLY